MRESDGTVAGRDPRSASARTSIVHTAVLMPVHILRSCARNSGMRFQAAEEPSSQPRFDHRPRLGTRVG